MPLSFPSGYSIHGYANDGNTVSARRSDSSPEASVQAQIRRIPAKWDNGRKRFSVPTIEVTFVRGLREGEPLLPIPEQEMVRLTFREPVGHSSKTLNIVKDLIALVNQEGFYENCVKQALPVSAGS